MKPLIVANWKMNPQSLAEAKKLFNSVKRGVKNIKNVEVVICPPFIYLSDVRHLKSGIQLGAQDCFWEEKGAFTGEVSTSMLKDLGVEYVIIGHSERRKYCRETDQIINKKIKTAFKKGLKPILCIGETAEERKKSKTFKVLNQQLKCDLESILNLKSEISNLIIAYEPVWAIGTGKFCQPEGAKKVKIFIEKTIAKNLPIIYGGSVNSKIARDYLEVGFQGLLVGGASLDAREFTQIVKNVSQFFFSNKNFNMKA